MDPGKLDHHWVHQTSFWDALKNKFLTHATAASLISALKAKYAALGISGTFVLFKELLDTKITQCSHPTPFLNKVATPFAHLKFAVLHETGSMQSQTLYPNE